MARVGVAQFGALTTVTPTTALTHETAREFATAAIEAIGASSGRLGIDLSRVAYVDSEGLEALLDASDALGDMGHPARLIAANDVVRETLRITDLDSCFQHFGTTSDAARSLS